MIAIAHFVAISCYLGAAALAAAPFARPVSAPVRGVVARSALPASSRTCAALLGFAHRSSAVPLTGLGPALSFAGLVLALTLLIVEVLARDVSLTLVAAPLAAIPTICANLIGLTPGRAAGRRARRVAVRAHRAELRRHRGVRHGGGRGHDVSRAATASSSRGASGRCFRFFPPLATLDRVNHLAAIAGWLGLTLGVVLAATYSVAYHELNLPQLVWGTGAWLAVTCLAFGRIVARMAGAARGEVFERRVRRGARAVRRVPRRGRRLRASSCERISV